MVAVPVQELTYDNEAVVDYALEQRHRECSDVDLRLKIQEEAARKKSNPDGYQTIQTWGRHGVRKNTQKSYERRR